MSAAWRVLASGEAKSPTEVGLDGMASPIKALARCVHKHVAAHLAWRRTRRQLAHLDERLLRDIGAGPHRTRADAASLRGVADILSGLLAPFER